MVYNCICNIIRASSQIAQRNRRACGASGCEAAILSHLVCILQLICGGSRFASLLDHIVADRIIARFSAGVLDRQLCAGFRNATDAYLDPRGLCGSRRELHTCHPTECLTLRMEYNCVCHIVRIGSQAIQVCRSACCPSRCEIVILRHLAGSFQFLCGGSRFASLLDHIVADRIGTCFFAGILNRQLRAGLRNVTDAYLDPRGLCGSRRKLLAGNPTECLSLCVIYDRICYIIRTSSQVAQSNRCTCGASRCEAAILRHLVCRLQLLCGGSRFASLLDHIVADRIGARFSAGVLNRQLRASLRNIADAYCRTGHLIQIRCSGDRNNPNQQDKRHQKRNCGVSCFPYMCF